MNKKREAKNTGIVYKITNTINNKIYIGQAQSYIIRHGKLKRHGLEGRWKSHLKSVEKGINSCPYFHAAIKKYDKENFKKEILEIVSIEILDEREFHYIVKYDACNNKIGYNLMSRYIPRYDRITNGTRIERLRETMLIKWKDPEYRRKTQEANLKAVIKRATSGKTRKKYKDLNLPANIYKTDDGYDIRIMRNGRYKITSVNDSSLSDKEKRDKAKRKLDEIKYNIKNGIYSSLQKNKDHNGDDLPKGVVYFVARDSPGYKVVIRHRGKRREKTFTSRFLTMDRKLELAKNTLIELKKDIERNISDVRKKRPDHNGNELPTGIRCILLKEGYGYIINIKGKSKQFTKLSMSNDERLEAAKKFLANAAI